MIGVSLRCPVALGGEGPWVWSGSTQCEVHILLTLYTVPKAPLPNSSPSSREVAGVMMRRVALGGIFGGWRVWGRGKHTYLHTHMQRVWEEQHIMYKGLGRSSISCTRVWGGAAYHVLGSGEEQHTEYYVQGIRRR